MRCAAWRSTSCWRCRSGWWRGSGSARARTALPIEVTDDEFAAIVGRSSSRHRAARSPSGARAPAEDIEADAAMSADRRPAHGARRHPHGPCLRAADDAAATGRRWFWQDCRRRDGDGGGCRRASTGARCSRPPICSRASTPRRCRACLEPLGHDVTALDRLAAGGSAQRGARAARRADAVDRGSESRGRVVVGTHALVQEGVAFADLRLVVVDEQHRFGVAEREALTGKGTAPHVLLMTATPIPRRSGQIVHADLDVTDLRTPPRGRQQDPHRRSGAPTNWSIGRRRPGRAAADRPRGCRRSSRVRRRAAR